jgi:hypothetical protein
LETEWQRVLLLMNNWRWISISICKISLIPLFYLVMNFRYEMKILLLCNKMDGSEDFVTFFSENSFSCLECACSLLLLCPRHYNSQSISFYNLAYFKSLSSDGAALFLQKVWDFIMRSQGCSHWTCKKCIHLSSWKFQTKCCSLLHSVQSFQRIRASEVFHFSGPQIHSELNTFVEFILSILF